MTTLYDNDAEFQKIENSKTVSPQATRWLWGFLIFMVAIFFITGVLTSHKDIKLSETAYHDVLLAKEAVSTGNISDAKSLTEGLSRVYGDNWHVVYLKALIAFKEGDIDTAKVLLDKISKEDKLLSFAEREPNYIHLKFDVEDALKLKNKKN